MTSRIYTPQTALAVSAQRGLGEGTAVNPQPSWPVLSGEAYHGLAGQIARKIEPHTEADPVALLVQTLVLFGNAIGRSAYYCADGARHHANLFAVMVGRSSKGRKGTSFARVAEFFNRVDPHWMEHRQAGGLSSGEGIIAAVHDPEEEGCADGSQDKRLLVVESEFAQPLRVMRREGNTLSTQLRQAWDTGNLRVLTKNNPLKATGAHISIVGHITLDELRLDLRSIEAANGFANRFLWCCVQRSKFLPDGGSVGDTAAEVLALRSALEFGRGCGEMQRGKDARELWHAVYERLSADAPGIVGNVTSRAEAQTLRLAMVYALLDGSHIIRAAHLRAALRLWNYCAASARYIFGDTLANPTAQRIWAALKAAPDGMTRTEINEQVFHRNAKPTEIETAFEHLEEGGLARRQSVPTGGRPAERWHALSGYESNELNEI
jgi:hypothetical protein